MTDFSSGDWTSTSDEKRTNPGVTNDSKQEQAALRVIFHDLNDSVCDSYPQDPVVWPPPAVQLHKMRLLNLIGWSVLTHGSCPQGPVCNRKRQR